MPAEIRCNCEWNTQVCRISENRILTGIMKACPGAQIGRLHRYEIRSLISGPGYEIDIRTMSLRLLTYFFMIVRTYYMINNIYPEII